MKKLFKVGTTYRLKANPLVISTYSGGGLGIGMLTNGKESDSIKMTEPSLWVEDDHTAIRNNTGLIDMANLLFSGDEVGEEDLDKNVADTGIRKFDTGASRNSDEGKLDYEGFLSPLVLEKYSEYMHGHRKLEDGSMRDSDNWQKGIPVEAYMKSMWRHFMDVWKNHRGLETPENEITNLCAVIFNASGMLHEKLKEKNVGN